MMQRGKIASLIFSLFLIVGILVANQSFAQKDKVRFPILQTIGFVLLPTQALLPRYQKNGSPENGRCATDNNRSVNGATTCGLPD